MEDYTPDFFEMSLCKDCEHMISRLIEPINPEDFGMTQEEFDEEEIDVVEQNTCLILNMDIMYKVVHCNKYKKILEDKSIFMGKKPLF